jgi:hypothetical protein
MGVWWHLPQVEEADGGVKEDIGGVISPRLQLVEKIVETKGQHG